MVGMVVPSALQGGDEACIDILHAGMALDLLDCNIFTT